MTLTFGMGTLIFPLQRMTEVAMTSSTDSESTYRYVRRADHADLSFSGTFSTYFYVNRVFGHFIPSEIFE